MPLFDVILFISGFVVGAILTVIIYSRHQKSSREIITELGRQSQLEKVQELEKIIAHLRESFGSLSMDVLSKSTNEFIKLANQKFQDQSRRSEENLQGKKALIDQTLSGMKTELNKVQELVSKIENERKESYGQLSEQLKNSVDQTRKLQKTANQLNNALSHSQVRGQWGERMAEDVLRMAGLIEGINYKKQKSLENSSSRPDFTFLLPHDLCVNMDVKFPLTNYLYYLEASNDLERDQYKNQFLRDVRQRVKEVVTRDYIDPANNTVDYMIVFIPNEQVYAFINENDQSLLDTALKNKVILSSPITLYAILAVIRQSVENFNLEQTATQILDLLSEFNKQWEKFKDKMDGMGKKIDQAQKEFFELNTIRSSKLEKPLQKIDTIRTETNSFLTDNT